MPKIPRYERSVLPPGTSGGVPMSPGAAAAPYEALAGAGERIERVGTRYAMVDYELAQKERIAQDAIEATRIESSLKNGTLAISESFFNRTDYQNFDTDIEKQLGSLRDQLSPKEASPRLQAAFEKAFEQQAFSLKSTIKAKKYDVMEKVGRIAFGDVYQQALSDYANETDPNKKEIIKNELFMKGHTLQLSNAVDPLWLEGELDKFDVAAQKIGEDQADVSADQLIEANPAGAVDLLRDSNYLPNLPTKLRQDKIEKATAAKKVFDAETERKNQEALKAAHDEEERNVGDLYMQGEYTKAFTAVQNSKILTGDEKKAWADSISQKLKSGENIDPVVQAIEVVEINGMISREEDPAKIRSYIVQTPNLKKEDKEQYLNKLDAKLSADEKEGRRVGYARIKDIIVPKRGILNPLTETPNETAAVRKAQDALDEWIDSQKKQNKYPTSGEIRARADQLANSYQIPISQKMEEIEKGAKSVAEQMRIFTEQKAEYSKIPEDQRNQIEAELIKSGYPASMANVISVYKRNYTEVK